MSLNENVYTVLQNFNVISKIENHTTLAVEGDKLTFETRTFSSIRRYFTGDSRHRIAEVIKNTFVKAEEIVKSYRCNVYLQPDLELTDEQSDVVLHIQNNLMAFVDKKKHIHAGLTVLSTHQRYLGDLDFQILIEDFKRRYDLLIRECESILEKMKKKS